MMAYKRAVFSVLLMFGLSGVAQATFETSLSDVQVQSVLEAYFPLKEYAAIARVTMQEPKVQLLKNNKHIVLVIPVEANIIGDALHRGHIKVKVGLNYKAATGGLYLSDPQLEQFDLPGVGKAMVKELREFIIAIVKTSLPLVRVYKLKERDMNHSLAKTTLKSFQLDDHRLKLEFGFK